MMEYTLSDDSEMRETIRQIATKVETIHSSQTYFKTKLNKLADTADRTNIIVAETAHKSEMRALKSEARDEALKQDVDNHVDTDEKNFALIFTRLDNMGLPIKTWIALFAMLATLASMIVGAILAVND